jgi:hypothetical protein
VVCSGASSSLLAGGASVHHSCCVNPHQVHGSCIGVGPRLLISTPSLGLVP